MLETIYTILVESFYTILVESSQKNGGSPLDQMLSLDQ